MVTWRGRCECEAGWGGERCARRQETSCQDEVDNDKGEHQLLRDPLPPPKFKSYDLVLPCHGLVIVHSSSTNKWVEKWLMAESLTFNFAKVSP